MKIELDAVCAGYRDRTVLRDLSLTLTERRIGLIGDNGSGKSTFARLLNGLVVPDAGRVLVDDLDTAKDGKAVRRKVGFLFQNPDSQIVMPTVLEDVAFGLKAHGATQTGADRQGLKTLTDFGIEHLADRPVHGLSGGEKQLVALAGVMAIEPDFLVCDEPTAHLDRRNSRQVMALIARLPCSVLVVTHHVDLIADFDRLLLLRDGAVVGDGDPAEVMAAYDQSLEETAP